MKAIKNVPRLILGTLLILGMPAAHAVTVAEPEVKITPDLVGVEVMHEGKKVAIARIQDQENLVSGFWAKTSRKCPPFCIHPMNVAPGVATVGEIEVLDFIEKHVKTGSGIMVDARMPDWHAKGTIPGSVNIPFTVFTDTAVVNADSVNLDQNLRVVLRRLGARVGADGLMDFTEARELLLWCNGVWCDQSPRAIKGLLRIGYPSSKLRYYRGGMQEWMVLGLSVVIPGQPAVSPVAIPAATAAPATPATAAKRPAVVAVTK